MSEPLIADQRVYQDLHELESQVYRWDVVFKKISIGKFHGSIGMIDLGEVQLLDVRFSGTLFQYGYAPEGYVTLVLPALDSQPFWWHFRHISNNCLISFPENRLLNAISGDGFHIYIFSIKKSFFEHLSNELGIPHVKDHVEGSEKVFSIEKQNVYQLNSLLQILFLKVLANQDSVRSRSFIHTVQQEVPEKFLNLVSQGGSNELSIHRERDRSMSNAIEFILAQDLKTLSVSDIEAAIGIKRRTLEYAFKEYFQVGPKYFIKALRLNQFRHELITKGDSVAASALENGFSHMGQLSRDYKLLFNELPSETLKSSKMQRKQSGPIEQS